MPNSSLGPDEHEASAGYTSHVHAQGERVKSGAPAQENSFIEPEDRLWNMYLTEAEKDDRTLSDNVKGDTDGILIFTGLFAATVAAFISQSYPLLSQNPSDTTVALLFQISQQISTLGNSTLEITTPALPGSNFLPSQSSIYVNALWFLSLLLSLWAALTATLMQQWTRRYTRIIQQRGQPRKRGILHVYLSQGVRRFGLMRAVEAAVALLHASVFLFIAGLIILLFAQCRLIAWIITGGATCGFVGYFTLSAFPLCAPDAPYRTPLTALLSMIGIARVLRTIWSALCFVAFWLYVAFDGLFILSRAMFWRWRTHGALATAVRYSEAFVEYLQTRAPFAVPQTTVPPLEDPLQCAMQTPDKMVYLALRQTLKKIDENHELEEFLVALTHILQSNSVQNKHDILYPLFVNDGLKQRMKQFLRSCMLDGASGSLSTKTLARRVYLLGKTCRDLCPLFFQSAADTDFEFIPDFIASSRHVPALEWKDLIDIWDIKFSDSIDPQVPAIAACARAHLLMQILKLCPETQRHWLHDPVHHFEFNHTQNLLDLTYKILVSTCRTPNPLGDYASILPRLFDDLALCVTSRIPDRSSQVGIMLRRNVQLILGASSTHSNNPEETFSIMTGRWTGLDEALKCHPSILQALRAVTDSITL